MKEKFKENGHTWEFSHWRIAPPGHKLPCPSKVMTHIPPEGIFVNEEGLEIGLSPENPLVKEEVIYQANSRRAERRRRGGGRHR